MPNWCSTRIWFYSEDKEPLEEFCTFVHESISEMRVANDFGSDWLGNVLVYAGMEDEIDGSLRCRGSIIDVSEDVECDDYYYFTIDTETAWVPMIKMWVEILKRFGLEDEIKIAYQAEECGCELFVIYDESGCFGTDRVYIDSYGDAGCCCGYYASEDEALGVLRDFFNKPEASLNELVELADKYAEENEYDSFISVHVFEDGGLLEFD